ncbi:multidrug ABC transporter permease/ATP-binding protein [Pendulispora brunnea]|uniref:Multidrug ABC transporter permease/ATP-binding protein n=1 Tax=Pendulispora brunnea TaxID=2905690 RepID=A0ABZ2JXR1_9BACT
MNLLRSMFRQSRRTIVLVLAFSIASSGLSVLTIAFINERLLRTPPSLGPALLHYAGLLLALFAFTVAAHATMVRLAQRSMYELRRTLVKRVLDTDIERLEALGSARILASLSSDTGHITTALIAFPAAAYGATLSICGFGYLAWLSPRLFLATAAWIALVAAVSVAVLTRTYRHARAMRESEDGLYADYQAVIEGRKELALNRERARFVYEHEFEPNALRNREQTTRASILNGFNDAWINAMVLGAIGLSFFLAHGFAWASTGVAATYALTILFLRGPLTDVAHTIPVLVNAGVSLDKVNALELAEYQPAFEPAGVALPRDWTALSLEALTFRYPGAGEGFHVGPIDLTLRRGEVVFLVGGNGSGKSTIARLLTGLYRPRSGRIRIDGKVIRDTEMPSFRGLFASVFSDFHLFRQVLGPGGANADESEILEWLDTLDMTHKVSLERGALSDTRFSFGQRKRLALLLAVMEDRPILVLDEWAADQDPVFRRIFYTELLPVFKAAGKTVFAITHDEHYFHLADRVLKADGGQLFEYRTRHESALRPKEVTLR